LKEAESAALSVGTGQTIISAKLRRRRVWTNGEREGQYRSKRSQRCDAHHQRSSMWLILRHHL